MNTLSYSVICQGVGVQIEILLQSPTYKKLLIKLVINNETNNIIDSEIYIFIYFIHQICNI